MLPKARAKASVPLRGTAVGAAELSPAKQKEVK